jgi:predicted DNA-binding transcriptional regulator YafY
VLDGMERRGLVHRVGVRARGRRNPAAITPAGQDVLDAVQQVALATNDLSSLGLDASRSAQLTALLLAVIEGAEAAGAVGDLEGRTRGSSAECPDYVDTLYSAYRQATVKPETGAAPVPEGGDGAAADRGDREHGLPGVPVHQEGGRRRGSRVQLGRPLPLELVPARRPESGASGRSALGCRQCRGSGCPYAGAVTRTDRLYALVEELRRVAPRPRSARLLAERFEVSTRTIERDLSALQQAGVPIWAEPGRTGGYCIDAAHTLAPLGFTVDEGLAVAIGLAMLGDSPFAPAAASARQKVLAVTEGRRAEETTSFATRVLLLEDGPSSSFPAGFADALRRREVLRMRYRDRDDVETVREVEPLGYVHRDRSWYLIGWCRTREGIRAFRADRIVTVDPTGERPPRRELVAEDLAIPHGDLRAVYAIG